jgi:hypothetical protein
MNTYGERLEKALKDSGRDRKWLADKIGITVQALSPLMAGKTVALTATNHEKAVAALKVDGYWLANGTPRPTDPFANPAPPLSNVYQIREAGSYYGKPKIVEAIKILEGLSDEALLEAVYWLRGFAAGKESEKKSEATLPNHPVPTAPGAAG